MINDEYSNLKLVFKYISHIYNKGDIDEKEIHDPGLKLDSATLEKCKYFIAVHPSFNTGQKTRKFSH